MQKGKKALLITPLFCTSCCLSLSREKQLENRLPMPCIETSVQESLESPFFSIGEWPQACWWTTFEEPVLNTLMEEVLSQNPSIQEMERRVVRAQQEAVVIRSPLFPLVFFDATETWEYLSKNGLYRAFNPDLPLLANLIDLTFSFTYEFDFWGKNANHFLSALGRVKEKLAETAQAKLIATTALAQGYFALKTNLIRKQILEALLHVRTEAWNLQNLLLDKALVSQLSPLLAQERVFEAKKLAEGIEEEIATNRHLINILAGRGPDTPLEIDSILCGRPRILPLPAAISSDLIGRRPDLLAQIWKVDALAHEVGAALADFFPDVNLIGFLGLESTSYRRLFEWGSRTAGLKPAIHLPIFTAGAIAANVEVQKASFDAEVFVYNALLLRSVQEITDILAFAKAIFSQKNEQEQIVERAQHRYRLTQLRRQKGLDNLLEEYTFQEEVLQKQLVDSILLYNQYLAYVKLIRALGGGFDGEQERCL